MSQKIVEAKDKYEFKHKGNTLFSSYILSSWCGENIDFVMDNRLVYKVDACPRSDIKQNFNFSPQLKSYLIKDFNSKIRGYAVVKKTSFLFGYLYYELMFDGTVFTAYEVGKGKDGLFLTIFNNEEQICLIEKDISVKDYEGFYSIYLKEEAVLIPMILINMWYHALRWSHEKRYSSTQHNGTYNTTNKFLNSTYNPNFKNNISE